MNAVTGAAMDVTARTADLAEAAGNLVRLLPARLLDPVLSGLLVRADPDGVELAGTDRDRAVRLRRGATTRVAGQVLVPARPLAETLRALDSPDVRLVVEGSRLAIRTPSARFALPLLDVDTHPGVPEPPTVAGRLVGSALAAALVPVAGAASRDDTIPLFTGVRVRSEGERLVLVATDRYRMAVASLPWEPRCAGLDVLLPAALLAEVARQAAGAAEVELRCDPANPHRAALSWPGAAVGCGVLASPFPDEARYLTSTVDCEVLVAADALAAAVRRVAPYAGPFSSVRLAVGGDELRVQGSDPASGEAEETLVARVDGEPLTRVYRAQYLGEALKAFAGTTVRLGIRGAHQSTRLTAVEPAPDGVDLRYVVMPIRPR
ncbi:DNA polymerase III subunit beta [Streptoalloteichus hindustanus]|uniref:DNA polymerase-3 subunit beta n=1 Tax=Streptoalloteichus hindustanus TaxID=2017 RepID=A0A1M4VT78_STRHI|nr:DNA polymerase III subunit beta [Streptoalloteichus hindustanus]SHE72067.1 DNA polymerase-3 subunit beta [Streptoalloteichus hindustanus]